MPSLRPLLAVPLLVTLLVGLPQPVVQAAGPVPEAALHGSFNAKNFTVMSGGVSKDVEHGLHRYHLVCTDCYMRLGINTTGLKMVRGGVESDVAPGWYEIHGFAGHWAYTRVNLGNFSMTMDGTVTLMGRLD